MKKPLIKRVDDNKSKGKTYSALIRKYNEAIESGFYGEAELVVYAFLEDRLRSFIYYSDLLDNINSNKLNEKAAIINGGVLDMDIKNISRKIQIIQRIFNIEWMRLDGKVQIVYNCASRSCNGQMINYKLRFIHQDIRWEMEVDGTIGASRRRIPEQLNKTH